MKPPVNYALHFDFDVKMPRQKQYTASVTIFRPEKQKTGEWACRIAFRKIQEKNQKIYGEDPLQALLLGLCCVRVILGRLNRQGFSIWYPATRAEIDLDMYFRSVWKEPNESPEPTTLRVTPAAVAPVAPRSVAAHL
jgi:hypothetical protein